METSRKIGLGIVLIVPATILAGAVWAIFESWIGVVVIGILMGFLYGALITGKIGSHYQKA